MTPHPLTALSIQETEIVRDVVLKANPSTVVLFREIFLHEPPKAQLQAFLECEHSGQDVLNKVPRQGCALFDLIDGSKNMSYCESIVDIDEGKVILHEVVDVKHQPTLTLDEFDNLIQACKKSKDFQDEVAALNIPDDFELVVEPWPYGGLDLDEPNLRYFQGLCFAQRKTGNPDSNFYAFPIPLIPVMDAVTKKIVRVDKLPTGGIGDGLREQTHGKHILEHCVDSEYVPELLTGNQKTRENLMPLSVVQPSGPSYTVQDSLVEWQNWRFRVGFNPREGATIHDVWYDNRSVLYRLSVSEMTVPYADPRFPFHRKQAFDFGDGGAGNCANNLSLGCDCLGVIKYFDGVVINSKGEAKISPNVVCLHEQDSGIGWKHTNWRTQRAIVTRHRELVVQFIITLANYEYIFAYKFDQSGGISVETRATGIVSVVNIDPGKTSAYGNVVSPGALAQNHQHIFAFRVDPAIDGPRNTIICEESHPVPMNEATNPAGNMYEVRQDVIKTSQWLDAAPQHNRTIKMVNTSKKNRISGKPVGYKFTPTASQLLLADPASIQARRAQFATHHVWVTKYKDGELYAGGRYTMQSRNEVDGVADAIARKDELENEDVVIWNVFGLTHNPRVEDWPVMPVEIHEWHIRPADFFEANPSINVPSSRDLTSKLADRSREDCCSTGGF
ncbi:copper amine oxidase 1 [Leptodontidium sp. MPI-SDFR-AT-0119]|nr:copper amine oxidase 1 [Leptodontidium sp. MPI-SDFR-AT-0119]